MLAGKRILVTGGSRGIGAAIIRAVHREGANVVLHYGSNHTAAEKVQAELGDRITLVQGDLNSSDSVKQIWNQSLAALGRIDVLVNNAGVYDESPLEPQSDWQRGWARNLQINLQAPADFCRLAIAHFAANGGGTIVNISSRSAHRGDDAEHLAYAAAKGGLLAITKGIARAFGPQGVLAYAVAPGWVLTEMAAGADLTAVAQAMPLREITPPEDVAEMVAFLASGRSRHSTGGTFDISGADYVR